MFPPTKQLSIPAAIEDQLEGESRQTARLLFDACYTLMWAEDLSWRISSCVSTAFAIFLTCKDVGFIPAFAGTFLCLLFTRTMARNHVAVAYGKEIDAAVGQIRYLMNQRGSVSVANWLTMKDQRVGRIIQSVVLR